VNQGQLEERIAELAPWHYQIEFDGGVSTPISDPAKLNRHEQRRRYFFEALLRVTGGSLEGRRVLDVGCNAGYWASLAIEAGADFLLGVDARERQLDQARLVFEAKGIDPTRYRFEEANVFEHDFGESFDVVLCLGLMYHVSKPMELFEVMAGVGAELIVVDTIISPSAESIFRVRREPVDKWLNAADMETVFIPSRQAVIDLAAQFGFETVPLALNMSDLTGLGEYRDRRRLAFICSRSLPLNDLDSEPERSGAPTPRLHDRARRWLRRRLRGHEPSAPGASGRRHDPRMQR
jgi:SAM-dependent methyltransferase